MSSSSDYEFVCTIPLSGDDRRGKASSMETGQGISVKFLGKNPELYTVKTVQEPVAGGDAEIKATSGCTSLPHWMFIQKQDETWTLEKSRWS
jgi:hypothetical protein